MALTLQRRWEKPGLNDSLKSLYYRSPFYRLSLARALPARLNLPPQDMLPGNAQFGASFARGELNLAGQKLYVPAPDWAPQGASPAFQNALQSFLWMRDLKALGGDTARRIARVYVGHWIEDFHDWHKTAWRADIMGTRLATWLTLHDFFLGSADDEFRLNTYDSIARQALHLSHVLKPTLSGPVLLAGLRGLLLAGIALDEEAHVAQALSLYETVLEEQILADGGHVTRSPRLMVQLLRQLVEARSALRHIQHPASSFFQPAIDRLSAIVRFLRHGDGGLVLFHDTNEYDPVYLDTLLNLAEARTRTLRSLPDTGYERLQLGRTSVMMDTGAPPPAPYDNGAHAGLLAFEMCSGKERIIVNCGAEPGAGPWHNALRATAAHSTLCIADTNAVELMRDGGVGRRRPSQVIAERHEGPDSANVTALHDAYRNNFSIVHQRSLNLSDNGDMLDGVDTLKRVHHAPAGAESDYAFAIRFHTSPNVQATLSQDGHSVLLRLASGAGWRLRCMDARLKIEPSIYQGQLTQPRTCQQIVIDHILIGGDVSVSWSIKREKKS